MRIEVNLTTGGKFYYISPHLPTGSPRNNADFRSNELDLEEVLLPNEAHLLLVLYKHKVVFRAMESSSPPMPGPKKSMLSGEVVSKYEAGITIVEGEEAGMTLVRLRNTSGPTGRILWRALRYQRIIFVGVELRSSSTFSLISGFCEVDLSGEGICLT
eukprot:IDg5515t1